jgi:hypothetical protein
MQSAAHVYEPFSTEGHLDGPKVIPNPDSDSTEVHNLGHQLCGLFSRLHPTNPTKRAYDPEQTGVPFRGNGRLIPRKRAGACVLSILGEMDPRKCQHELPGSEETGVPSEPSRAAHHTGVVTGCVL